jgi:hypothetical protein
MFTTDEVFNLARRIYVSYQSGLAHPSDSMPVMTESSQLRLTTTHSVIIQTPTEDQYVALLRSLDTTVPDLYQEIATLFPKPKVSSSSAILRLELLKTLGKGIFILALAGFIALCMFIQYFFSSLAGIKNGEAYAFGVAAFSANTAMSTFLLVPFILSLFSGRLFKNMIATFAPWTTKGREILTTTYGRDSHRYRYEMTKPAMSLVIKFFGTVAALTIACIFFENTDAQYHEALIQRPEELKKFTLEAYDSFWVYFNFGSIPINFLLFAIAYVMELAHAFDTDLNVIAGKGAQPFFLEMTLKYLKDTRSAIVACDSATIKDHFLGAVGVETPTALAKIHYIKSYLSATPFQTNMEAVLRAWLHESAFKIPGNGVISTQLILDILWRI